MCRLIPIIIVILLTVGSAVAQTQDTVEELSTALEQRLAAKDFEGAVPIAEDVVRLIDASPNPDKKRLDTVLLDLVQAAFFIRSAEKAEVAASRLLALREEKDPWGLDVALPLQNLGTIFAATDRPDKAEAAYQRLLKVLDRVSDPNKSDDHDIFLDSALNNLLNLYAGRARDQNALEIGERALTFRNRKYGSDAEVTIDVVEILAIVQSRLGHRDEAAKLFARSLAYREARKAIDQAGLEKSLENAAIHFDSIQDYAEAERFYLKALVLERLCSDLM